MNEEEPILVVDDDDSYRSILQHRLSETGFRVLEANNCRDAFKLLLRTPVRVVVLDIVMPDEEGLETIRTLRRAGITTKILAISGCSRATTYLETAARLGAIATMEKTRPMRELVELVQVLYGCSTASPALRRCPNNSTVP